jgi:hypothetical protein
MGIERGANASPQFESQLMSDIAFHDTYIVWNWALGVTFLLVDIVLILGAAALIKYLFFR